MLRSFLQAQGQGEEGLPLGSSIFPRSLHNRIARFLENQGYQAEALAISKDCRKLEHLVGLCMSSSVAVAGRTTSIASSWLHSWASCRWLRTS